MTEFFFLNNNIYIWCPGIDKKEQYRFSIGVYIYLKVSFLPLEESSLDFQNLLMNNLKRKTIFEKTFEPKGAVALSKIGRGTIVTDVLVFHPTFV